MSPCLKNVDMNKYVYYSLTITFRPIFTIKEKFKLIKKLDKMFSPYEHYEYSIEYHKYPMNHPKKGLDNPCAPHVHVLLVFQDKSNRLCNVEVLNINFLRNYGSPKWFVLHEEDDVTRWLDYMKKDTETLNTKFGIEHYFTSTIE